MFLFRMGEFCLVACTEPGDSVLSPNIFVRFCIFGIVLYHIVLYYKVSAMSSIV